MSKYGLQIRVKPSVQHNSWRPRRPPPSAFLDYEDDDMERDICRQASKNNYNKEYEELHKKALEEDPMAFEYDKVFDNMKQNGVRKTSEEDKPKYIPALIHKSKVRELEREIVNERKIGKERQKDDHLHLDKQKFVTGAYKGKLAKRAKWEEEERLRERKEDITNKGDMSEFYFNLSKNIAFGASEAELRKKQQEEDIIQTSEEEDRIRTSQSNHPLTNIGSGEDVKTPIAESSQHKVAAETVTEQSKRDHHKHDVAAAKERFLARKRAKVVEETVLVAHNSHVTP